MPRLVVDLLGDRLLARAALAEDEHARVGEERDAVDALLQGAYLRRLAHQLAPAVAAVVRDDPPHVIAPRNRLHAGGETADRRAVCFFVLVVAIEELCRLEQLAVVAHDGGNAPAILRVWHERRSVHVERAPHHFRQSDRLVHDRFHERKHILLLRLARRHRADPRHVHAAPMQGLQRGGETLLVAAERHAEDVDVPHALFRRLKQLRETPLADARDIGQSFEALQRNRRRHRVLGPAVARQN